MTQEFKAKKRFRKIRTKMPDYGVVYLTGEGCLASLGECRDEMQKIIDKEKKCQQMKKPSKKHTMSVT